ncbi:MAG: efflux RND transporter periplasmic adaptor subunit [Marinoscillum sp.]
MSNKKTVWISIGIIALSVLITSLVFFTEPEAKREGATKKTAMLVEAIPVSRQNYHPVIVATGNVQASRDITLSSQVSGAITSISSDFTPGAYVKKGQMLIQIDPSDYRNTLKLRESDLKLAESDLSIEMGRQDVAMKDYELVGEDLSSQNKSLVLREPQLASAQATVEAAEAAVEQARLNLRRTTIRAPFDAHIISRNANTGSQVAVGAQLGRIVGMKEYWIVTNIPVAKIPYLSFEERKGETGTHVEITSETNWPAGQSRVGRLYRLIGALDDQTRLARVIVRVMDPLAQNEENMDKPPLMIGAFVEVHLEARELPDVVRLDRAYLRKNDDVWVIREGKLEIRDVTLAFQDARYAYISEGLEDQEQVITSNLATVVEEAPLRREKQDSTAAQPSNPDS